MEFCHANGKLLLSGEYLVLHGAKALALPLKQGQSFSFTPAEPGKLHWVAKEQGRIWLDCTFDANLEILEENKLQDTEVLQKHNNTDPPNNSAEALQKILNEAAALMKGREFPTGLRVECKLEFRRDWGWGSSSTLLWMLGRWLNIDPYTLMDRTIGGSGYDIACAGSNDPLFYRRLPGQQAEVVVAPFNPPFLSQLGVVWTGRKQSSASEVKRFLQQRAKDQGLINRISEISEQMAQINTAREFSTLMDEHERLVAGATGLKPVREQIFPDFPGSIKSLGAWGGDFVLFMARDTDFDTAQYFTDKGYKTLFGLGELLYR